MEAPRTGRQRLVTVLGYTAAVTLVLIAVSGRYYVHRYGDPGVFEFSRGRFLINNYFEGSGYRKGWHVGGHVFEFNLRLSVRHPGPGLWSFIIPIWPVAIISGVGALWLHRAEVRRARAAGGLCIGCGYSRRGLAESAKCPECGTTPTPTRG